MGIGRQYRLILRGLSQKPEDYKEHELAAAPKSWQLLDPFAPDCRLTTDKKSSMWDFLALDLLNEDQNGKWSEEGQDIDDTRSEFTILTTTGAPSTSEWTPAKRGRADTPLQVNKIEEEGND